MMSHVELQRQMLNNKMSIVDTALALSLTKKTVTLMVNGKKAIPEWVEQYFKTFLAIKGTNGTAQEWRVHAEKGSPK